jgi:hypothetical protein
MEVIKMTEVFYRIYELKCLIKDYNGFCRTPLNEWVKELRQLRKLVNEKL